MAEEESRVVLASGKGWAIYRESEDDPRSYLEVPDVKSLVSMRRDGPGHVVIRIPGTLRDTMAERGVIERNKRHFDWNEMYQSMINAMENLRLAGEAGRAVRRLAQLGHMTSTVYAARICSDLERRGFVELIEGEPFDGEGLARYRWRGGNHDAP